MRFYTYVIANTFLGKGTYDLLMNDVIIYGTYQAAKNQILTSELADGELCATFISSSSEKSRISKVLQFQQRFENMRKELIEGQDWVESSIEDALDDNQIGRGQINPAYFQGQISSQFEVIHNNF